MSGTDSCSGGQVFDTPVVEGTGSGTFACFILEVRNQDEIYSVSPCTAARRSATGGFQPKCWISGAWADCLFISVLSYVANTHRVIQHRFSIR